MFTNIVTYLIQPDVHLALAHFLNKNTTLHFILPLAFCLVSTNVSHLYDFFVTGLDKCRFVIVFPVMFSLENKLCGTIYKRKRLTDKWCMRSSSIFGVNVDVAM